MPRPPFSMAFLGAVLAGCTVAPPNASLPGAAPSVVASRPPGLAWSGDGSALWIVRVGTDGCRAEHWDAVAAARSAGYALPFCPTAALGVDRGLLLRRGGEAILVTTGGVEALDGPVIDFHGDDRLELRDGHLSFQPTGHSRHVGGGVIGARLVSAEAAVVAMRNASGDSLIRFRTSGDPIHLAGPFAEIDSFDTSPDGRDVVFSARRDAGFDIGIVASDGGEVGWVPPDPLDERMVSWAPRGNKVTFRIETASGSVLRSVHIPTGFQLSVPMGAHARELAWEPRAERFAVRLESPSQADRIDVLRYGGEERRTVVAPAAGFPVEGQPLEGVPGGVAFAPEQLRYDEKVPVVIWVEPGSRTGWSSSRLRLYQNRRSGTVVVPAEAATGTALWAAVASLPWADLREMFVVVADSEPIVRSMPASVRPTILTSHEAHDGDLAVTRVLHGDLDRAAADWLERELGRAAQAPSN